MRLIAIYKDYLTNVFDLHGRVSKKDYWTVVSTLFFLSLAIGLALFHSRFILINYLYDYQIDARFLEDISQQRIQVYSLFFTWLVFIFHNVRYTALRLHDIGRSSSILLFLLIYSLVSIVVWYFAPVFYKLGIILLEVAFLFWVLVLLTLSGERSENKFGYPKKTW